MIQSTSLSHTAGFYARAWPPSLVLGGYDLTRLDASSTLEIDTQDLTQSVSQYQLKVNVTGMTIKHNPLADIPVPIKASLTMDIDPVTPQIWLLEGACNSLEEVFRLEWNKTSRFYFMNVSTHEWLLQENPNIKFSMSSSRSKSVKNYTLSYASTFALNLTYPLVDTPTYYFPLKRSKNMFGGAFFFSRSAYLYRL